MLFVTLAKYLCNILIAIPPINLHILVSNPIQHHITSKNRILIIHPKTDSFRKVSSHI